MLSHADAELYEGKRQHSLAHKDLSWATALATAADSRSNHQHSSQTAALAAAVAQRLEWQEEEVRLLRIAAMLHDIGKVGVSERVLQKPDPLTVEERQEIEMHPLIGAALVARIESVEPIAPWIRHSHEHYDGSGYPDGLAGEAIPPASRIILVADAFDVMRSDRPYRRAWSTEQALEELRRGAGLQFDPHCVEALAAVVESGMVPTAFTPPLAGVTSRQHRPLGAVANLTRLGRFAAIVTGRRGKWLVLAVWVIAVRGADAARQQARRRDRGRHRLVPAGERGIHRGRQHPRPRVLRRRDDDRA